jgi:hypothetical protein
MTRYYILILKIVNALIFVWILTTFFSIFNFDEVITTSSGELVLTAFFISLKNMVTYLIFTAAYGVAYLSVLISSLIFLAAQPHMITLLEHFFRGLLSLWFTFPNGTTPDIRQIPELIGQELAVFNENIYLITFQILIIISIIYAIKAFLVTNPKNDLIVVGSIVLMLVIPLMVFGFKDMLDLFNMSIEYLEDLPYPLDISLEEIPIDDVFQFFASPVILLAIASYIYLEMAFQINYTYTVTEPSLERSHRLEAQLTILQSESYYITANVDKIKEEAKKRREELKIEDKTSMGISGFFAKTGERFSYVKEMIEKKKLEEEEKKLITAASKTRRLGRYIHRLFQEDFEARDTITAKSSAPKPQSLVVSTIINFLFRFVILVIISFIIIHPKWFMEYIFQLPPAIVESVVMYSPETIIILLIPLMLIFPVISKIISSIKHRNLIIRLQQEGRIKEILASVGDYVKIGEVEEEKEVEIEEAPTQST